MADVIVASGLALIHFEKYSTLLQHISNFLGLVVAILINLIPISAMAKWVELVVLKTKVASDLWRTSDSFHIFVPDPLCPKLPWAIRILV